MSELEAYRIPKSVLNSIIKKLEKQIRDKEVKGTSKDRGVIVVLSGSFQVLSVKINQRLVNNPARLENSVAEAVDDALQKGIELLKKEAQKLLGN
ncbi:MAG TPA: YbaB/EbfC family nucleoid-associated protein [Syntrophomonadaceae bacterium]|nr:YbaB/EbfC family nucleoid-associated protein [Syntrophomonadaceae bacterium]